MSLECGNVLSQINFNLRLPAKLNAELIRIAQIEGRSKNKQIEYILKQYVENYNKGGAGMNEFDACWETGNYEDQECELCPHKDECSGYKGEE